jgi:basic membrane protein A
LAVLGSLFVAVACNGDDTDDDTDEEVGPVRVAVVFSGRGEDAFGDLAGAGIDQASATYGDDVEILEVTPDDVLGDPVVYASDQDVDLVVAVGFPFVEGVSFAAPINLGVDYTIIDAVVPGTNVASYLFAEEQGSFLVGAAAGLKSTTGTMGFLGGLDIELINKFMAGYWAGIAEVDSDATNLCAYSPDPSNPWGDRPGGRAVGTDMYTAGADVVYAVAGGTGWGVLVAAEAYSTANSTHVWYIGVDTDQYQVATDRQKPHVLTSMLKHVDVAVVDAIADQVDGTFRAGTHLLDLEAEGVGYATSGGFIDDIVAQLEDLKDDVIDGTIVVPTTATCSE